MILVALALVMFGVSMLAAVAGYALGREERIDSYEAELDEQQRVIDVLLPKGVKVLP